MIWIRAGALCLFIVGCVSAGAPAPGPAVLRASQAIGTGDAHSAWFADERDGVVYFGLSDFWTAYWATGDPTAELRELYRDAYAGEPFVQVVDTPPATKHVFGSNLARVFVTADERIRAANVVETIW